MEGEGKRRRVIIPLSLELEDLGCLTHTYGGSGYASPPACCCWCRCRGGLVQSPREKSDGVFVVTVVIVRLSVWTRLAISKPGG